MLIIFLEVFIKDNSGQKAHFDNQARLEARNNPEAWKAVLESGKNKALYTFANRVCFFFL